MVATMNNRWLSPPANIRPAFQAGQKKKAFLGPEEFCRGLFQGCLPDESDTQGVALGWD
jgi:hypothetical protein